MARSLDEVSGGVLVGALARARAQAGALTAALALLVLAATLAGTSAHLLTGGQDAALAAALDTATPEDVTAVVRTSFDGRGATATTGPEQQRALDDAATALTAGSAPAPVAAWTAWTSSARYLEPDGAVLPSSGRDLQSGTLAVVGSFRSGDEGGGDDGGGDGALAAHADLVTGRWPAPASAGADSALEGVVPVSAVEASGGALRPGGTAVLAPAPADGTASAPLRVVVVGTYRPRADDPVWQLDPLHAAGSTTAADVPGTSGRVQRPAVGPLLLDPGALTTAGPAVSVASGGVVAVPQLAGLSAQRARALATAAASGPPPQTAVREALGDRVSAVSVVAALPRLLERSAAEQRTAGAGLLVATAVGAGAALVALAALAQLLAERRREEAVLLAARGASPAQQVVRDAAEVVPLALVAVLVSGVLSALTARALLGVVLGDVPGIALPTGDLHATAGAPLAMAAGTGVLAVVVVLLELARGRAARPLGGPGLTARAPLRSPLVRSGADLLLLVVAVAAWWQLRSGDARAAGGAVLVVAPALALLASALIGLRVLSLLRRAGERTARRSARAPGAVAGWALARGPVAAGTAVLVVLSAATATTALAWRAAWSASTAQQVSAALGADVVVETPSADDGGVGALRTAAALAAATGTDPSPVALLPVALGTRSGAGPVLLVSAPSGVSSAEAPLLEGPVLPAGAVRLVVTGRGQGDGALAGRLDVPALGVVPSLVVRDPWRTTAVLEGQPLDLDGQPHEVALPDPGATGRLQVVGAWLRLLPSDDDAPLAGVDQRLEVRLALPGTSSETSADWTTTSGGDGTDGAVTSSSARVEPGGGGSSVVVDAVVRPAGLPLTGAALRALAAPAPEALAVRVSPELAAQVGAVPGQQVGLTAGEQQLVAQVTAVVPVVPTAAGASALLVEPDALDAALLAAGAVPVPDRWWLPDLAPAQQRAAVAAVGAAGLGSATALDDAVVRAQRAPLAAALRAAWLLLLVAAAAAALAGPALQVAAAAPEDARTSARLAVLGVSRRERVRVVVGPRAVQLALGLLVGAVAGVAVAVAVVPVLVRAPDGGVALPRVDAALVLRSALTGAPLLEALAVLVGLVVLAAVPLLLAGVAAARREGAR